MRPVKELLRDKRDGKALTPDELRFIAHGIGDGTLSDAQCAAFAMAVFFRGLDADELYRCTDRRLYRGKAEGRNRLVYSDPA